MNFTKKILIVSSTLIAAISVLLVVYSAMNTNSEQIKNGVTDQLVLNPHLPARSLATGEINTMFQADAYSLVQIIEETHPIFSFTDMLDDNYERIRDEFLNYAARAECETDFRLEIQRYFRVLQDGHMSSLGFGISSEFLDIEFVAIENKLYLV